MPKIVNKEINKDFKKAFDKCYIYKLNEGMLKK